MTETTSSTRLVATLPTGTLTIEKTRGPWSVAALLAPGARQNPRRPFLLVSRVLGKHLPVAPSRMRLAHVALAKRLPADLPGPVCFIGLAETATGLGWGVFEAWRALSGRDDGIYCHSTRSPLEGLETIAFDEVHSHGPNQVVCVPDDASRHARWQQAVSLVLVDDELTTGATLLSLRSALPQQAQRTCAVTLLVTARARAALNAADVEVTALAEIDVDFAPNGTFDTPLVVHGLAPLSAGKGLRHWGRAGAMAAPAVSSSTVERCHLFAIAQGASPIFVVGAAECMHPAFVLGMALEAEGLCVLVQSTTRSPVLVGGAIGATLDSGVVPGTAVPLFLHNPPPRGACVIAIHEPGDVAAVDVLVERYGALAVEVWDA